MSAGTPADDVRFRRATASDARDIALLHADSWRRHYRGAYSDAFLDGDLPADRLTVWSERLRTRDPGRRTVLAEHDAGLVGFVHLVLDDDPTWGALLDNLHVDHVHRRHRIGSRLFAHAAAAAYHRGSGMYLWVQEQNRDAQAFYRARGGRQIDRSPITPPGGVAGRLLGAPWKLRFAWTAAEARRSEAVSA